MKENSIRKAVREGRAALGTGIKEFATRGMPWIVESSGFDYAMIDMEHGAFDLETIANLAGWFEATHVSPIVRIHKAFIQMIPTLLDQGIKGIQISEVETGGRSARDCAVGQVSADRQSRHFANGFAHQLPGLWCALRDGLRAVGQRQHDHLSVH